MVYRALLRNARAPPARSFSCFETVARELRAARLRRTSCTERGNSASAHFVNGLSITQAMADHRPPLRPGLHSARSGESFPDDRERINRARQAAEALFAPKPRTTETSVSSGQPPAGQAAPAPRRLSTAVVVRREALRPPDARNPPAAAEIPAAQLARIHAWVKYGMTVAQVAEVYGVAIAEIERMLRKA